MQYFSHRPERVHGNPGIWATKYKDGWTVYTVKGIYKVGLSYENMKNVLAQLKLRVKGGVDEG